MNGSPRIVLFAVSAALACGPAVQTVPLIAVSEVVVRGPDAVVYEGAVREQLENNLVSTINGYVFSDDTGGPVISETCNTVPEVVWRIDAQIQNALSDGGTLVGPTRVAISARDPQMPKDAVWFTGAMTAAAANDDSQNFLVDQSGAVLQGALAAEYDAPERLGIGHFIETRKIRVSTVDVDVGTEDCGGGNPLGP